MKKQILIIWEVLKMAFSSLRANRLRTILTLLGVIIGVTSVITIISALEGMGQSIEAEINRLGPTTFVVSRMGMIRSEEEFFEAMKRKPIKFEYMKAIEEGCEECEAVAARAFSVADIKYQSRKMSEIFVVGATANFVDLVDYEIGQGRFHSEEEDATRRRVAFIGYGIAEELFPNSDPIGKSIKINNIKYEVIGIAKKMGSSFGNNRDNVVIIPYTLFTIDLTSRHFGNINIMVKAKSVETMDVAMDQVRVILRAYRHVAYNKEDDFAMLTPASIMEVVNETTKYLRLGLVGISSISLVVGGIIIMNIMMVSVTERTREIGIRKSIGAKQKDILFQFLFESIIVSLGGGIVGIVLGSVIADILIGLMNMNMSPSLYAIGLGLGISTGTGLFFGIYPAMKAARLQPVKALSFE